MLRLDRDAFDAICALAFQEYPLEMCGLIAGAPETDAAERFYACRNAAESAKVYEIDPLEFMRVEDDADERPGTGLEEPDPLAIGREERADCVDALGQRPVLSGIEIPDEDCRPAVDRGGHREPPAVCGHVEGRPVAEHDRRLSGDQNGI